MFAYVNFGKEERKKNGNWKEKSCQFKFFDLLNSVLKAQIAAKRENKKSKYIENVIQCCAEY